MGCADQEHTIYSSENAFSTKNVKSAQGINAIKLRVEYII